MPGLIALIGSGETTASGGQTFDTLVQHLNSPVKIAILETPAGFELNADIVAGRVGDYLKVRLQNYRPEIIQIPARRLVEKSTEDQALLIHPLLGCQLVFMGPGSPSYAVRQLKGSLVWDAVRAKHRQGTHLAFSSAAAIASGMLALPVYEIYKVGEDPHWKPGLDLFADYGLKLIVLPHWNNHDGGEELDTTRCFLGKSRFEVLRSQLPADATILGIDEHTSVILNFDTGNGKVMGRDAIHILRDGRERHIHKGETFPLQLLGEVTQPDEPFNVINERVQTMVRGLVSTAVEQTNLQEPPREIIELLEARKTARQAKDWERADLIREQIAALGWEVRDTPEGMQIHLRP